MDLKKLDVSLAFISIALDGIRTEGRASVTNLMAAMQRIDEIRAQVKAEMNMTKEERT